MKSLEDAKQALQIQIINFQEAQKSSFNQAKNKASFGFLEYSSNTIVEDLLQKEEIKNAMTTEALIKSILIEINKKNKLSEYLWDAIFDIVGFYAKTYRLFSKKIY